MNERTKTGLEILEVSILLGILGDALLRSTPLGLNVFLYMTVFIAAIAALVARRRPAFHKGANRWLYVPLIVLSAFFAWRDSDALMLLNAAAILATLTLIILQGQNIAVRIAGFLQYGFGAIVLALHAAFAPFYLLFGDIKWKQIPQQGWTKHLFSVARGLAIAVPLLLVFGGLFMAADAVFEGIVKQTFNIDPETLFTHGFLIAFFAWTSAGFLRGTLIEIDFLKYKTKDAEKGVENLSILEQPTPAKNVVEQVIHQSDEPVNQSENKTNEKQTEKPRQKFFSLGLTETSIVLGLMNLLFLSFVVVQIRYFFGGAEMVGQITDLTYSEYARRGFFELVWVAALVLPILLIVHWLLRKDNPTNEKVFRYLAGGQIVLLFVIMASALQRMFLYQNEYGLTELRFYTTAFMFWLAIIFVLFCVTVLVGRRERFAFSAYLTVLLVIVALHFVNPDAMIVRVNTERMKEGKSFDANYASRLSADAIPILTNEFPNMAQESRCVIQNILLRRMDYEANADWRSWNWSRSNAWKTAESQAGIWDATNCPKHTDDYDF